MESNTKTTTDTKTTSTSSPKDTLPKEIATNIPSEPKYSGWLISNAIINFSTATVEQFIPLYANLLGANSGEIGLISGLYSLLNLSQIFWSKLSQKLGKTRIFVALGWLLSTLFYIPLGLLKIGQIFLLLLIRSLQGLFVAATVSTHASLQADHIIQADRARRISQFTEYILIGSLIGALFGGFMFSYFIGVSHIDPQTSYLILFFWSALLGLLASLIFIISVPDYQRLDKNAFDLETLIMRDIRTSGSKLSFWNRSKVYLTKFGNFWWFTVFACVLYFAVYLASPFFIILEVNNYNFSYFEASILSALSTIVQISITVYVGKNNILDKFGRLFPMYPAVILIALISIGAIFPFYIPWLPAFWWCVVVWMVMGFGWGVFNVALQTLLLDIIHPKYRATFIAIFNTIMGCVYFLGSITGGFLIDFFNNTAIAFIFRFLLLILAFFLLFKVKEPPIPGTLVRPRINAFFSVLRHNASRGPEIVVSYGSTNKTRVRHWFSTRRRFRPIK